MRRLSIHYTLHACSCNSARPDRTFGFSFGYKEMKNQATWRVLDSDSRIRVRVLESESLSSSRWVWPLALPAGPSCVKGGHPDRPRSGERLRHWSFCLHGFCVYALNHISLDSSGGGEGTDG